MTDDDIVKEIWALVMLGMTIGIIVVIPIAYHYITEVWGVFQSVLSVTVAIASCILSYGFAIDQYKNSS